MKAALFASISFVALSILAPCAEAQQKTTTVTLMQKYQPVIRSYPGVAADLLGIRTGMTVAQAEAIAEKSYPAKPHEYTGQGGLTYKEVSVSSHQFLSAVQFANQTAEGFDVLSLYFGSPVTGNTLYAVTRDFHFGTNADFDYDHPANDPLMGTLEASLIKKYGTPSTRLSDQLSYVVLMWAFSQKSKASCDSGECIPHSADLVLNPELSSRTNYFELGDLTPNEPNTNHWQMRCGVLPNDESQVFAIHARINNDETDRTKARELQVSIWDPAACMKDYKDASKQLNAAAIKFYNTVSKAPAAPKM